MADDVVERSGRRSQRARRIVRLCPACGEPVHVDARAASLGVVCPRCGATVGPDAAVTPGEALALSLAQTKRGHPDSLVGWAVSLGFHVVVLGVFLAVTLPSRATRRTEAVLEREALVVHPADALPIGAASPKPLRLEPLAGELAIPRLKDSTQIEPIWQMGEATGTPSKVEQVIGIDVGGGGDVSAAMKGDWTDFAAGGGGAGSGGASFFGLEARGERFVFVVDRSGSMHGEKLDAAKAELVRSIRGLGRDAKFYTIFFNTTHTPMPARDLVRAVEGNLRRHFEWISGIQGEGGTDPTSAMKLALSLKPDAVWLLSDGIFHARAADAIRQANPGKRVQVHAIAFYSQEGEGILQRIAAENRGRYRFVSPASIGLRGVAPGR